jgi:hypothetical protein
VTYHVEPFLEALNKVLFRDALSLLAAQTAAEHVIEAAAGPPHACYKSSFYSILYVQGVLTSSSGMT